MTWIIIASVILQALSFYFIGKGRLVYPLVIATYTLYAIVEGWLAMRDPEQVAVWLYVVLNIWCIAQALKGWMHAGKRPVSVTNRGIRD